MATTQAQPTSSNSTIHAFLGNSFNLNAAFGPGGSASVDLGTANPYVKITGCGSKRGMTGQAGSLSVTFVAAQVGNTEVTFVIYPRGDEPIAIRQTHQVQIGLPNGD